MDNQSLTGLSGAGDLKVTAVIKPPEPLGSGYELLPEQAAFFKAQTGIHDDNDLKRHILALQRRAYEVFPYTCIRRFTFLQLGMTTLPEYKSIIKFGRERPDGILLDIGCCFGVDARMAVADGFPLENVVTTDLKTEFFDLGHALFNTTPQTYPICFVPGDAFDPNILRIVPPLPSRATTPEKLDLSTLTSLNPLAGRCSIIYASNFFHLFSEVNQLHLAKALAGLLSPLPGSMICGEHVANVHKGDFHTELDGRLVEAFQHCPESWKAVWDGDVFSRGRVRTEANLKWVDRGAGLAYHRMQWSVVRL